MTEGCCLFRGLSLRKTSWGQELTPICAPSTFPTGGPRNNDQGTCFGAEELFLFSLLLSAARLNSRGGV